MSRPPSRADKPILDLTSEHAQASASVNYTQEQDEDAELQRAIKMSLGQEIQGQENGVTGAGQQFGPALRDNYDMSKWSVAKASSREIVDHPQPAKRRRIEGEPAFLRGSRETGYLAPLLTIFHSIPLAREALLFPSLEVTTYGYVPDWWSGNSDENRKSLTLQNDHQSGTDQLNFLAEVQCLMAFLDNTKRAYGSVDALADLYGLRSFRSETNFTKFLEAWKAVAIGECPQEQLTQIFSSTAMKSLSPDAPPLSKELVCLEPQVNRADGQLLVDLLDTTVWNDNADILDDVWISECAEVFTIHMYDPGQMNEGLLLTPSPVWFPDRYMWHCRDLTREMRQEIQVVRKEINKYSALQWKCQYIPGPSGKRLSIQDVLNAASKSSSSATTDRVASDRAGSQSSIADVSNLDFEVQAIIDRIDEKLDALEQAKEELQKQLLQMSRQLTQPSEDTSQPPYKKYVLQGVSTKPHITYVRRRNPDLLGLDDDSSSARQEWQWWRMSWADSSGSEPTHPPVIGPLTQSQVDAAKTANGAGSHEADNALPYSIIKVSEEDVIEAAKTEHNAVVLVYANQNAMDFKGDSISEGLGRFVNQDNIMFERECADEVRNAEWGSEETFENVTLNANEDPGSADREMTPISGNSPHRDELGQPSPKRPKSSDADWKQEDDPPSYDDTVAQPEMQERPKNKIGIYADQLLERYGNGAQSDDTQADKGVVVVEHSTELPR